MARENRIMDLLARLRTLVDSHSHVLDVVEPREVRAQSQHVVVPRAEKERAAIRANVVEV